MLQQVLFWSLCLLLVIQCLLAPLREVVIRIDETRHTIVNILVAVIVIVATVIVIET